MNVASSAGANAGMGGMIASGGAELSVLKLQEGKEFEASVLNGFIGGEIGLGSGGSVAGYSLGIDVINVRQGCFQLNVGIDAGSGMTFGFDGVEVKVGGAGISIGKKMGISTPVGGMSVNLEKVCVVQ